MGEEARAVSKVALELGVCWWTVMNAVIEHGTPLVDDPERIGVALLRWLPRAADRDTGVMLSPRRPADPLPGSGFVGFRSPPEVILLAVRWYLRFSLTYRDVEELLAERGIYVDHVTVYRWVQRFTPLVAEAARPCRHAIGDRWHVDETYLKVGGNWRYLYRAIDQLGQVVEVLLSSKRDAGAARRVFMKAMASTETEPAEVVTDRAQAYLGVLDELLPAAFHDVEQYANNVLEADHGRLKSRLRPMRGLKTGTSAQLVACGHAFIQNLRRRPLRACGRCSAEAPAAQAFAELAPAI